MKRINVGYIGWFSNDDTEYSRTAAVCDINEQKVQDFVTANPGVKGYTDWEQMLRDEPLDAVVISTPNWLHCPMSVAFLDAGVHVFCEKPMGIDRAEMDAMLAAQRRSGCQLALDFEMRASSGNMRIKEILDSGELGEIRGFEFVHHRGAWLDEGAMRWRTKPEKSGGLYFMEVCHEVDFMRWVLGEIVRVQSFKLPNVLPQYPENMPDNVCTHFWFASGARGLISANHALSVFTAKPEEYGDKGHDMYFVFYGTKGSLRLDSIRNDILVVKHCQYPEGSHGVRTEFDRIEHLDNPAACHDILANRRTFLKAIAEGRPHIQDAYDAWRTHVVCQAAERSAIEDFQAIDIDFSEG